MRISYSWENMNTRERNSNLTLKLNIRAAHALGFSPVLLAQAKTSMQSMCGCTRLMFPYLRTILAVNIQIGSLRARKLYEYMKTQNISLLKRFIGYLPLRPLIFFHNIMHLWSH